MSRAPGMRAGAARTLAIVAGAMLAMAFGAASSHDASAQDATGSAPAPSRTIRIYRCTDVLGRVTLQNDRPCPKNARQEMQSVEAPTPMPSYVPREERMPEVVAAERAAEAAAIATVVKPAPAKPGPPPALYACRTWDQVDYLTEDAKPTERCAPLQVVGVDGAARGDAAACENVVDQCAAVPAENLCQAWRRRVDEAEFRWKFAGAKQDDDRRREYELLRATLAQSDCAR